MASDRSSSAPGWNLTLLIGASSSAWRRLPQPESLERHHPASASGAAPLPETRLAPPRGQGARPGLPRAARQAPPLNGPTGGVPPHESLPESGSSFLLPDPKFTIEGSTDARGLVRTTRK